MENSSEKIETIITFLRQNKCLTEDELQRLHNQFQDASDFFSPDKIVALKEAYEVNDIRRFVFLLYHIAVEDHFSTKRGIRKFLYTDNLILPNPLNYAVCDEEIEKAKRIIILSIDYFRKIEKSEKDENYSKEVCSKIADELTQIFLFYDVMYDNHKKNEERLNVQPFLKHSLAEIIHSMLVYHQDQMRLARRTQEMVWDGQMFITGMESRVTDRSSDMYSDVKVAIGDSFEQLIEQMDALFRYIYFLKADDFKDSDGWKRDFLIPYESKDFKELALLCMGDVLYEKIENRFRYTETEITTAEDPNGVLVFVFSIGDVYAYKIHIAAGLRREHNFLFQKGIYALDSERTSKNNGADTHFYQEYFRVSERLDVSDIESFHFDNAEYAQLEKLLDSSLSALREHIKDYYFTREFSNIKVESYLNAYVYLYTFSKVYYAASLRWMDEEDINTYSVLIPFVNIQYLYQEFSNLYPDISYKSAKELINCFIFDNKVSKDKSKGDLFTRPLVKVNKEKILLSEALIDQMNLERNIEVLLESYNVDISSIGKDMEKRVIKELSAIDTISVNTVHVEFFAFDSRNVEFDCIATFGNYLMLIEMKSLYTPYSDFDLFKRKKHVKEGVEQVNRRARIVKYDWEKIKKAVDIKLPKEPYPEEKIIKIVCTDIGDFTSLEIDGVIITDETTLLKYFTNPYVYGMISMANGVQNFQQQVLWKKDGRPTADEFIEYLHNPDTVKFILDAMGSEIKPLYLHDGCKAIAFDDITVNYDPWLELGKQFLPKDVDVIDE